MQCIISAFLSSLSSINSKPTIPQMEEICKKTNLSLKVVRVWFQNRRCKAKKQELAAAQQDTLPPAVSYMQHHHLCLHT